MEKMILWCKRNNAAYTIENIGYNFQCVRILCQDVYEYSAIIGQLYKIARKNKWYIDGSVYSSVIRIYNESEYSYIQEQNKNIDTLVNIFYIALREKTPNEAKQVQYEYAMENNMLVAFDSIYNR